MNMEDKTPGSETSFDISFVKSGLSSGLPTLVFLMCWWGFHGLGEGWFSNANLLSATCQLRELP